MEKFNKLLAHEQINSAISACNARIELGLDMTQAFRNLENEVKMIMEGEILYED